MENEREIKREMTQPQVPSKTGQTQDITGGYEGWGKGNGGKENRVQQLTKKGQGRGPPQARRSTGLPTPAAKALAARAGRWTQGKDTDPIPTTQDAQKHSKRLG